MECGDEGVDQLIGCCSLGTWSKSKHLEAITANMEGGDKVADEEVRELGWSCGRKTTGEEGSEFC
jgi:hypothetical protein